MCDDVFDTRDANVVCRELGYQGAAEFFCCASYGQGNGLIWLDDLACTGTETSVYNCTHNGFGNHNCEHKEDIGVKCQGISKFNVYKYIIHVIVNYSIITTLSISKV